VQNTYLQQEAPNPSQAMEDNGRHPFPAQLRGNE